MTIIEFYDNDAIENICSCMIHAPDEVIVVAPYDNQIGRMKTRFESFLREKGFDVRFTSCRIPARDVEAIASKLLEEIRTREDCVMDLTGGDDLYLVAAGILYERCKSNEDLKGRLQLHRVSVRNGGVIDVDRDGVVLTGDCPPSLSVSDVIRIYGGRIVGDRERETGEALPANASYSWDPEEPGFSDDVDAMWKICIDNPGFWNVMLRIIGTADYLAKKEREEQGRIGDDLRIEVAMDHLKEELNNAGMFLPEKKPYDKRTAFLNALQKCGVLREWVCEDDGPLFVLEFKNEQVKRCLTIAGQLLEMKVYLAALMAQEDGKKLFRDVRTGVFIDWDGEPGEEEGSVFIQNEIDVVMTRGMVPVFVSCKNGAFDANELNKLNTVATRFGGKYAQKLLIATSLEKCGNKDFILARADKMNITVVDLMPDGPCPNKAAQADRILQRELGKLCR